MKAWALLWVRRARGGSEHRTDRLCLGSVTSWDAGPIEARATAGSPVQRLVRAQDGAAGGPAGGGGEKWTDSAPGRWTWQDFPTKWIWEKRGEKDSIDLS